MFTKVLLGSQARSVNQWRILKLAVSKCKANIRFNQQRLQQELTAKHAKSIEASSALTEMINGLASLFRADTQATKVYCNGRHTFYKHIIW